MNDRNRAWCFVLAACGLGLAACGETSTDGAAGSGGSVSSSGGSSSGGKGAANAGGAGSSGASSGGSATGGASSGGSATGGALPADDRPARPDWTPHFPIGDDGWRESKDPLCERHQGALTAFQVTADARGVFALAVEGCNTLGRIDCGKEGVSLQFNDGTGWKLLYQVPPGGLMGSLVSLSLAVLPGGPVLVSGALMGKAGIWSVDGGTATLGIEGFFGRPFVVGPNLAYALGTEDRRLYRYAQGKWSADAALPSDGTFYGLWANDEIVVASGSDQAVYVKRSTGPAFEPLPGVPAGTYTAAWGFASDDLWLGNIAGQLVHYDGEAWTVLEPGVEDGPILGLWGSEGELFFRTRTEIGRVVGTQSELIVPLDPNTDTSLPRITTGDVWGLSPKEVFVTLGDREFAQYACGETFILWFDGAELHPF